MDWLITLIIGGVVGWLASLLMKADAQMGLIANVLIGIVGSMLGYWLAGLMGVAATGGSCAMGGRCRRRRPADLHSACARGFQASSLTG